MEQNKSASASASFSIAADGVNPARIPSKTLYTGARLPGIGLGTFGSDKYGDTLIADAVEDAIHCGYRHIDCAAVYGNEKEIGEALENVMSQGLPREELWITSKLWNDKHGEKDVIPACRQSLKDLRLDYLDLYLIHWPFPHFHAKGVGVTSRDPHAAPYIHSHYMKTWRQLEKLVEMGLVKHIGTSNMTIPKLELLLKDAAIKPACNEMELHPHFQQPELFRFIVEHGIQPIGYSPLGSPGRPERDKTPQDTVDLEDRVLVEIAAKHACHPAAVCLKWAVQRGQVPIPFSVHRKKYLSNLHAVAGDPLTPGEMQAIAGIDKNCRLIKGQVFLWKTARSWEDLWDVDGFIPGADSV